MRKLKEVVERLKTKGLKLKLTKRTFLQKKKKTLAFLEHVLDADGGHATDEKVISDKLFLPQQI